MCGQKFRFAQHYLLQQLIHPSGNMHYLDIAVVVVYMGVILALGFVFGKHQSRDEFFVASRSMGWLTVGLSVMATLFSSNSFVYYTAAALGDSLRLGAALVAFTLMTPFVMYIFIPVYAKLKVNSAYEYLEKRFHVSLRALAAGLFVLLRIGWMASATYAAAVVVSSMTQFSETAVIITLGLVAISYTMLGGLRAVMWTDVIQFFVFAFTVFITIYLILSLTGLTAGKVMQDYVTNHEVTYMDWKLSMTEKYGTWALLIGSFLEGLSAFGADQVAVQRYLSAKSEQTSKIGAMLNLAGMWIVIPGLLFVGICLHAHYTATPGELGQGTLEEMLANDAKLADKGMSTFVRLHFPPGFAGLFMAALLAAIMSSIDSGVHSVATVITVDFRDRLMPWLRPKTDAAELFFIRILVVVIGILSIVLACFAGKLGNVFEVAKILTAAFGGPLLAMFLLGFFSRRTTSPGVFTGVLIATLVTGALIATQNWFAMWYWPIGFGTAMILGYVFSCATQAKPTRFTFSDILHSTDSTS
ncbi:MAG: sodium/solute symporter [Planctomycetaceae bacterium]